MRKGRQGDENMRAYLTKTQDTAHSVNDGSWSPEGDSWGGFGDRARITFPSTLTGRATVWVKSRRRPYQKNGRLSHKSEGDIVSPLCFTVSLQPLSSP